MTVGIATIGIKPFNRVASGQGVNIYCNFTVSGSLADPTTVSASFRFATASATTYIYPTATTADAPLIRDASGVYHFDMTAISAGTYRVRFVGSSACQAADELSFDCVASNF